MTEKVGMGNSDQNLGVRYRLVVWDFDGTLADTLGMALATFNDLAVEYGFLPVDDPIAARSLGTLSFLRKHNVPLGRVPHLIKAYLSATKVRMESVRLFERVPEILRCLKSCGCQLGVLSSNSADNIRRCLRGNGVEDEFDFVVGYPRLFGKATALRRLLQNSSVRREQCLYIGDEVRDLEAAKKAGVDCAAAGWGLHSLELLALQKPNFVWSAPCEVLRALLRQG
jgi:phosphoglycolate phosphatase